MSRNRRGGVPIPRRDGGGEPSDAELVEAVLRREESAFRVLYRRHTPALFRLALRMSGGVHADAEDVVQEAWLRAVRGLSGFEGRSMLKTWLSSIVVRCSWERSRRADRQKDLAPGLPCPTTQAPHVASRVDLERTFRLLPPGFRAVLVLHDLEGYRHADISALLGIAVGTSKSQLSRARAFMRNALGEDYAPKA